MSRPHFLCNNSINQSMYQSSKQSIRQSVKQPIELKFIWQTKYKTVTVITGLNISTRPLTQARVLSVGRVQITGHSPIWRVRFFIAKKFIKLQNERCFLHSVFANIFLNTN